MTRDQFWHLIGLLDRERIHYEGEDVDLVTAPLVEALARLGESAIVAFDDHLAELLHALDGRAWADAAGVCGIYEDLFLYCRCVAVASGPQVYAAILDNPQLMAEGMEFERLLEVPALAWRKATGRDYTHVPPHSLEMGSNSANWD